MISPSSLATSSSTNADQKDMRVFAERVAKTEQERLPGQSLVHHSSNSGATKQREEQSSTPPPEKCVKYHGYQEDKTKDAKQPEAPEIKSRNPFNPFCKSHHCNMFSPSFHTCVKPSKHHCICAPGSPSVIHEMRDTGSVSRAYSSGSVKTYD